MPKTTAERLTESQRVALVTLYRNAGKEIATRTSNRNFPNGNCIASSSAKTLIRLGLAAPAEWFRVRITDAGTEIAKGL